MSLPPVNPDKSASGISVDPRTLERVVAASRRKDGSTRKELKIRPGFTPQEDVGLFRSRAQRAGSPSPALIPGSTRPRPQPTQSENPFAQQSSAKSKAQLKNEKRREKKRAESNKAWDESSDEDADGDMREAFNQADGAGKAGDVKTSEEVYPAAGQGAPEPGLAQEVKSPEDEQPGQTAILEKNPGTEGPETAAQMPGAPAPKPSLLDDSGSGHGQGTSNAAGPLAEAKQQQTQKAKAKLHPIQGGRQGPIGLAFPPPIEEAKAKEPQPQSRADQADSWRTVSSGRGGQDKQPKGQGQRGPRGNGQVNQNQNQTRPNNEKRPSNRNQQSAGRANEAKPEEKKPEQRVRKEVRVKQGGANDVTSLASRVKNLVLDSTTGRAAGGTGGARTGGVKKDVPVDGAKTPA